MDKKLNEYRHFFLYAKGHYKKTNEIDDLKQIMSNRCMVEVEYVELSGIYQVLAKAIQSHYDTPEKFKRFTEQLFDIGRKNIWATEMYAVDIAFIKTCLSIMFDAVPSEYAKNNSYSLVIDGDLGLPDESILPLSRKIKTQ